MNDEKQGWLDQPENVRKLLRVFYVLCFLSLVVVRFLPEQGDHGDHGVSTWPAFYAIYGFAGIVALVLLARLLRRAVLRSGDYYDA